MYTWTESSSASRVWTLNGEPPLWRPTRRSSIGRCSNNPNRSSLSQMRVNSATSVQRLFARRARSTQSSQMLEHHPRHSLHLSARERASSEPDIENLAVLDARKAGPVSELREDR